MGILLKRVKSSDLLTWDEMEPKHLGSGKSPQEVCVEGTSLKKTF